MYEETNEFGKWVVVAPNCILEDGGTRVGMGIIVDVVPMTEVQLQFFGNRSEETVMYHLMTDFGNISHYTIEELKNSYVPRWIEPNPRDRFERQQQLLLQGYKQYLVEA